MQDWGSILAVLFSLVFLFYLSLYAWKYKDITAIIIGIILINVFTLWAAIALYIFFAISLAYELKKTNKLELNNAVSFVLIGALKYSVLTVIVALAVNFFLQGLGSGSGSCGRGSPQWC